MTDNNSDKNTAFKAQLDALWNLLVSSVHCVAFTGAGVSTLSGIRDFRGKNGLYKTVDADKMFDIDLFHQDPSIYYGMARDFIYGLDDKTPSIVHRVLAELEKRSIVKAVITQNIDLLQQKAGSKKVIEIHGSPENHVCLECGYKTGFRTVVDIVRSGELPRCPKCKSVLKPEIVFFGESLPANAISDAVYESNHADLMLVLGCSLVVYPAASLPETTVKAGGNIVIVNDMPTYLDRCASLRFDDLESVFSALEKKLEASVNDSNS